jgi:glyoxylase-like metal-dependent hydrolase (beta-lactamase superfamily II)/rhodanese-related sulfurtransferase
MGELALHALVDEGLGNTAYLVDLGDGSGLAVDASRDLRALEEVAATAGLRLRFAADTHLHADFVTGAVELARRDGTQILASAAGGRLYPHTGLHDGDEVDLGGLTLRTLLTPGHTDEHVAFQILDGGRTLGVFTGGSLIVGSAARTDLVDPERAVELARKQYRSLQRLARFDDDIAVWPTHGAGSFCSAPANSDRTSTIGLERTHNDLLGAPDEDTFVSRLLGSLGDYPTYFRRLSEVNRRGPSRVLDADGAAVLTPAEAHRAQAAGAEVVDVRPVRDFAAGHIPGSLSVPLRAAFATWLGWLVDLDRDVVIVRDPDQDFAEVWWQAAKIGQDRIVGQVPDGLEAWRADGRATTSIELVDALGVESRAVLDIRERVEYDRGHLPDAHHLPLGTLRSELGLEHQAGRGHEVVPDRPTVVMCAHGERAMGAASLLARAGHTRLAVLDGGPADWAERTGHVLETDR